MSARSRRNYKLRRKARREAEERKGARELKRQTWEARAAECVRKLRRMRSPVEVSGRKLRDLFHFHHRLFKYKVRGEATTMHTMLGLRLTDHKSASPGSGTHIGSDCERLPEPCH